MIRSYLFVPGNRPERFAKAHASGAHAVIVDLEDAIPPAEKSRARNAVAAQLNEKLPVIIRINAVTTPWFRDDVTVCRMPGVRGVMLPKAESVADLRQVEDLLGARVTILPLIETARGFDQAPEIARDVSVPRLVFGALDFQLDLGIQGDGEELLYFRSQLVLISRLAGIAAPVDGINTEINDPEPLRAATLRARRIGFGGKLCIHPLQVAHVNECFRPTGEEIAWARQVLQAASSAEGRAVAHSGEMIDRPVMLLAERILREAGLFPED